MRDLAHLADLSLETRILGLLALVRLDDHVIQDSNLFLEITLDVTALSFCNVFYGVLLTFELSNFLASIGYLLFEHHDFFFKAVNGCFETERLLRSEGRIRLAHNGSAGHANLAHFLILLLELGSTHTYKRYGGQSLLPIMYQK